MEIIAGKEVLTTLEEIVDPSHTALIVVDMQNDFCAPAGRGTLGAGSQAIAIDKQVRQVLI